MSETKPINQTKFSSVELLPCSLLKYMASVMFNLGGDKQGRDEFVLFDSSVNYGSQSDPITIFSHSEEVIKDLLAEDSQIYHKLSEHEKSMLILERAITVESCDQDHPYEIETNLTELIQKAYENGSLDNLIDASQFDNSIEAVTAKIVEGINDQMDAVTFHKIAKALYDVA